MVLSTHGTHRLLGEEDFLSSGLMVLFYWSATLITSHTGNCLVHLPNRFCKVLMESYYSRDNPLDATFFTHVLR